MFSYVQSSMPVEGLAEEVKPVLTETSSSGLFCPSLGLGASYRVASHVMLGASIRYERVSGEVLDVSTTTTTVGAYPNVRIVFAQGRVQPYVQGMFGYDCTTSSMDVDVPVPAPPQGAPYGNAAPVSAAPVGARVPGEETAGSREAGTENTTAPAEVPGAAPEQRTPDVPSP